jgi:hypothetical protein
MLEAWNSSPGYFITLALIGITALVVLMLGFLKNRGYRHIERMKAMELNRIEESFFAGRLLKYIPWQFWTSFSILVVLILSSIATSGDTEKAFIELAKYVTGAVIGSLFGNKVVEGQSEESKKK